MLKSLSSGMIHAQLTTQQRDVLLDALHIAIAVKQAVAASGADISVTPYSIDDFQEVVARF
jgi:hypothetical protein